MNVLEKIDNLRKERNWSKNNLAMESLLTQSTINNLYSRDTEPKLSTLRSICNAFGISLSQFFMEDENLELLTQNEKNLVTLYRKLDPVKQKAIIDLLK